MQSFDYKPLASHIIFGQGTILKLADELMKLGLKRPFLLSTPEQVAQTGILREQLDSNGIQVIGTFSNATMHTPIAVTEDALEYCSRVEPDCLISIGGGSTIGLGKAISMRNGLHHIAIPTTYAGSEVTPVLGETVDGKKTTRSDPNILPTTVIYDVDLTLTLPLSLTITSGINAIAHAVEALYAPNCNPIIGLFAQDGIKALAESLPLLCKDAGSVEARSMAQYGAWLCGTCLGSTSMALHHKLCHLLGGTFNMPHSQTHTIILPHAIAYNAPAVPSVMATIAAVLPESDGDALKGINHLMNATQAPRALRDFGLKEQDLDRAAELALANPYANPRELDKQAIRELLRRAWAGEDAALIK